MVKLRAVGPVSVRDGDGWLDWKDGEVFEPPKHMDVKRALERGIVGDLTPSPSPEGSGEGRRKRGKNKKVNADG